MIDIFLDAAPNFSHDTTQITICWNVVGAFDIRGDPLDDRFVRAAVISTAAPDYTPPGSAYKWPLRRYRQEELGPGSWKAWLTYGIQNYQLAFKITGEQHQVRQSLETVASYSADPAETPPDFNQVIGWDGTTAHGTSIYIPKTTWSETVEIPVEDVDLDYRDRLEAIVAHTNSARFRRRDPGEVLFLGVTGSVSTANPMFFTMTFEFLREPNREDIKIGGMGGIAKKGWQYVWEYIRKTIPSGAYTPAPKPSFAYVERMYEEADFSGLNIGTGDTIEWGGE